MEDVDNWTEWADTKSKTHMLSHKTIKKEGNVVTCPEEEIAGGYRVKHTDRYTFYPKDKLVEEIIEGPISGRWELPLKESTGGTMMNWAFNVKPETLRFKIIAPIKGKSIMQGIADEYCRHCQNSQRSSRGQSLQGN